MNYPKISILSIIFVIIQFFNEINGQNWLINDILPDDYDPNVAPLIDGSVTINVSMRVNQFDAGDNQLVIIDF